MKIGKPSSPRVVVVIVNWNNVEDTLDCLASVSELCYDSYEIVVVDNASTDDSVAVLRDRYPDLSILENEQNLGYAGGNNVGLFFAAQRGAQYVLLLNNDALVAPDALSALVAAAECCPEAAILGPKIYHREEPDRVQSAGGQLDRLWRSRQRGLDELDRGQFDTMEDADYLVGAALLVRVRCLERLGLLDPDFFMYREDVDWCLRARRLKHRVLYVPRARVWHRSHHVGDEQLPRITYYMTRNSLLLLAKHRAGVIRSAAVALRHLITAATWTVKPKWRHKRAERDALLRGLADFARGKVGKGYV